MTVAELRGRMSSREFASWIAFDRISPIGDRRIDFNFAQLCALVASGLSGKRIRLGQFDLFRDRVLNVAAPGDREAKLRIFKQTALAITRKMGGTVVKRGDGRGS